MKGFKFLVAFAVMASVSCVAYAGDHSPPVKKSPTIDNVALDQVNATIYEANELKNSFVAYFEATPTPTYAAAVNVKSERTITPAVAVDAASVRRRTESFFYNYTKDAISTASKHKIRWRDLHRK